MSAVAVREPRESSRRLLAPPPEGAMPAWPRAQLLAEIERSGLTGRGGAAFPTGVKLAAVARASSPIVVANGVEGEPASWKDKVLLAENPHLVLDGIVAAARMVGAREAVVAVGRGNRTVLNRVQRAIADRGDRVDIRVATVPDRFVAGEESALVRSLQGKEAKPTLMKPYERGIVVQNVETLANVALVARYGADWFRERGTVNEPGTVLVTVSGSVRGPGVVEVELGTPTRDVLARCGGLTALPSAILVGGYFGTWMRAHDVLDLPLTDAALRPFGASVGARTIVVLPGTACGLRESVRVARYLATETAGQCGPCVFGLPAMADALERLDLDRLRRLAPQVTGRGACAHPTGATRFVASAVDVFGDEIRRHREGRCSGVDHAPVLPLGASTEWK